MHWLSLTFVAAYLVMLAHHAVAGRRRVHALEDYLVGGRSLGGVVVALSFYATFMSTNTFIGAAGESWDAGLVWCLGGVVLVACCSLSWYVVAPRFVPLTKRYQSLTVADFLGHRYQSPALRRLAAVIVVAASIIYLVAIYKGAAIALETMLSLPYVWSLAAIFLVVTTYTLAGGFHSVVMTDALQGLLMIAGAVAMFIAVTAMGGGIPAIVSKLRAVEPELVSWGDAGTLATVLSYSLAVGVKYLVEPRQLSRYYGLRDAAAVRLGAAVAPLIVLVTYICLLPIGAFARAFVPPSAIDTTDRIVPYLLHHMQLFGPVMSAFFLVVLLSAAMSSIDSVLLVAASAVDHDLIATTDTSGRAVGRTRVWVVIVSLLTTVAAVSPYTEDIVAITSLSGSVYGACFLPALVLGLFWRRPSAAAALASVAGGGAAVTAWYTARRLGWTDVSEVYVGMAAGVLIFAIAGLLLPVTVGVGTPGPEPERP